MGCGEEEVETLSPIMIHVPLRLFGEDLVLFVGVEQQC